MRTHPSLARQPEPYPLSPSRGGALRRCGGILLAAAWLVGASSIAFAGTVSLQIKRDTIGRGLEENYVLSLSEPAPLGGLIVVVTSLDPAVCVLSPAEFFGGDGDLVIPFPPYTKREDFWVQTLLSGSGDCDLQIAIYSGPPEWSVPAPYVTLAVVAGQLRFRALDGVQSTLEPPSPFRMDVGVPKDNGPGLKYAQRLSPPASCAVTACSVDKNIARIVNASGNDPNDDGCETAALMAPSKSTPQGATKLVANPAVTSTMTVDITASSSCFEPVTEPILVAPETAVIKGDEEIAANHQDTYRLRLSAGAPSTTTATVSVNAPNICVVSADETMPGGPSIPLTIEQGRASAKFTLQGIAPSIDPPCIVTGTVPGFESAPKKVDVLDPAIKITGLKRSFATTSPDDNFQVVLGVPRDEETVKRALPVRAGAASVPIEVKSSDDTVGKIEAGGNPPAGMQMVQISHPNSKTENRDPGPGSNALAFDPEGDGPTRVTAASESTYLPQYTTTEKARVDITVDPVTVELDGPDSLAGGLQDDYVLKTNFRLVSPTTFKLTATTTYCELWDPLTETAVGTLYVTIPANKAKADVTVLGVLNAAGTCTIDIEPQPGGDPVTAATSEIEVRKGRLKIAELARGVSASEAEDPFLIKLKSPDNKIQVVRADAALTVTVCSTNEQVAKIRLGTNDPEQCVYAPIDKLQSQTERDLVALVPLTEGTTFVEAEAIGFDGDDKEVRVSFGSIKVNGPSAVGRDLQDAFDVILNPRPTQGDVTLTLKAQKVMGADVCALSEDPENEGSDTLYIVIPKGESKRTFIVQGLVEAEDPGCVITLDADDEDYADTDHDLPIVEPALRIRDLENNTYSAASNDPFVIQVGIPGVGDRNLKVVQMVNPRRATVTVLACSSDEHIAEVIGGPSDEEGCRSATIGKPQSQTADGALKLDPKAIGETTITAKVPAGDPPFITTKKGGIVDVEVADLVLSIEESNSVDRVGAGLMDTFRVKVSQTLAENRVVTIVPDPAVCEVSVDEDTNPGDEFDDPPYSIQVTIPQGEKQANFQLHGVERLPNEAEGDFCNLTAVEPDLAPAVASIQIVPAAAKISYLQSSIQPDASPDWFRVVLGVKKVKSDGTTTTQFSQRVRKRPSDPGLRVAVCSSNDQVGKLLNESVEPDPQDCQSVGILTGDYHSKTTGTTDRIGHAPQGAGTTTIFVSEDLTTGFDLESTTAGSQPVSVTSEELSFEITVDALGEGLQSGGVSIKASFAPDPGGLPVTYRSLTPLICLVAANGSDLGQTEIDVVVPNNLSGTKGELEVWVQGIAQGDCILEGVPDHPFYQAGAIALAAVPVVQSAVQITGLPASLLITSTGAPFDVEVGVTYDLVSLAVIQSVLPGNQIDVDVAVSNVNIASLETSVEPGPLENVTLTIGGGASSTSGSGLTLVPEGLGLVTVTARSDGLIDTNHATRTVNVYSSSSGGGGCGLGFEAGLAVALIMALRGVRRRRTRRA